MNQAALSHVSPKPNRVDQIKAWQFGTVVLTFSNSRLRKRQSELHEF